ncbi:MAG: hypothetical protein ACLFSQ_05530 [Candidatus Zixiibacteriota bacterium]
MKAGHYILQFFIFVILYGTIMYFWNDDPFKVIAIKSLVVGFVYIIVQMVVYSFWKRKKNK